MSEYGAAFKDYLPVLVASIALMSALVFGLVLPRFMTKMHKSPSEEIRDLLSLEKLLQETQRNKPEGFDAMVSHYETKFVDEQKRDQESTVDKKMKDISIFSLYGLGMVMVVDLAVLALYAGFIIPLIITIIRVAESGSLTGPDAPTNSEQLMKLTVDFSILLYRLAQAISMIY